MKIANKLGHGFRCSFTDYLWTSSFVKHVQTDAFSLECDSGRLCFCNKDYDCNLIWPIKQL